MSLMAPPPGCSAREPRGPRARSPPHQSVTASRVGGISAGLGLAGAPAVRLREGQTSERQAPAKTSFLQQRNTVVLRGPPQGTPYSGGRHVVLRGLPRGTPYSRGGRCLTGRGRGRVTKMDTKMHFPVFRHPWGDRKDVMPSPRGKRRDSRA